MWCVLSVVFSALFADPRTGQVAHLTILLWCPCHLSGAFCYGTCEVLFSPLLLLPQLFKPLIVAFKCASSKQYGPGNGGSLCKAKPECLGVSCSVLLRLV